MSKEERDLGNEQFRKKQLLNSLRHYNRAIKYACFPNRKYKESSVVNGGGENCLAVALANRSAVYYELGDACFNKALQDIQLALEFGYPEERRTKLLLREASILAKQGKREALETCLANIKETLTNDHSNPNSTTTGITLQLKIHDLEMQMKKLPSTNEEEEESLTKKPDFVENSNFENASSKLSIKTSKFAGRHVIALADLTEEDTLFQELPFASVLLPQFYNSHCHHCHKSLGTREIYFFP